MTTLFRSLTVIGCLLSSNLTQPLVRHNFDHTGYNNYIQFAENELDNIKAQVPEKVGYYLESVWTEERRVHYMTTLYEHQRRFFQALLKCIKETKNDTFYSSFKSEIYKQWKNNFKRSYKHGFSDDWNHKRYAFLRWE